MIFNIPVGALPVYACSIVGAAGETVTIKDKNGTTVATVNTGSDGKASGTVSLRKGVYSFSGSKSGYTAKNVPVNATGTYGAIPYGATIFYWHGYAPKGISYKEVVGEYGVAKYTYAQHTAAVNSLTIEAAANNGAGQYTPNTTSYVTATFGAHNIPAGKKLHCSAVCTVENSIVRWSIGTGYGGTTTEFTGTGNNTYSESEATVKNTGSKTVGIRVYTSDAWNTNKRAYTKMVLTRLYMV